MVGAEVEEGLGGRTIGGAGGGASGTVSVGGRGADGGDPMSNAFLASGVRAADGALAVSVSALHSDGFGTPWGLDLTWTNAVGFAATGTNAGANVLIAQLPYLIPSVDHNNSVRAVAVVTGVERPDAPDEARIVQQDDNERERNERESEEAASHLQSHQQA